MELFLLVIVSVLILCHAAWKGLKQGWKHPVKLPHYPYLMFNGKAHARGEMKIALRKMFGFYK